MVSKWVRIDKHWYGFGGHLSFFNKVAFYAGTTGHWGIGVEISFYDRAITFDILNLYFGVEIWRKEKINGIEDIDDIEDFVPRSKGDLLD